MKSFLAIVQLIATIFPIIVDTVKKVEEAFPQPGQGPAKLDMVKAMLSTAYNVMSEAEVSFEQLWPSIQNVVAVVVAMLNATGVFQKSGDQAAK